jgi:hypothetical protein
MTNLEKLENEIRKALPELMELTEGCELEYMGKKCVATKVSPLINVVELNYCTYLYTGENHTILGHPITILHLLRWLGTEKREASSLHWQGYLLDKWGNALHSLNNVKLDLSNPLLRDQSEEVINELVKLINP